MTWLTSLGIFPRLLFLTSALSILPVIGIAFVLVSPTDLTLEGFKFLVGVLLMVLPIAALCFTAIAAQNIKSTMHALGKAHRQFRTGNFRYRIPLTGDKDALNLFRGFNIMAEFVKDSFTRILMEEKEHVLATQALHVAHDIRSPLAALEVVTSSIMALPEDQRLLVRRATARIRDIANNLMAQGQAIQQPTTAQGAAEEMLSTELLSSLIDPLVSEKRLQFRVRQEVDIQAEISESAYGLFARVQPTEFKRVLSNLVNNAVEGLEGNGIVRVRLHACEDRVCVEVSDTGKGVPPHVLPKLTSRGATFGKVGGSGLGLFHARERVEIWGGALTIQSMVGKGTTVTLRLPLNQPPSWFVPALQLRDRMTIVILDDDQSIHDIWGGRFEALRTHVPNLALLHFTTADDTRIWHTQQTAGRKDVLYLFDYELIGQPSNGLALIEQLQIQTQAILVTSRYEETAIRQTCAKLGVRLIPKGLAGFVPIRVESLPQTFQEKMTMMVSNQTPPMVSKNDGTTSTYQQQLPCDCVLIDDDVMVHMTWEMVAKNIGKTVRAFARAEAFFAVAQQIHKQTPIYVDSNLGDGIKGEQVTKAIHDMGFENIYLATGYHAEQFGEIPWVKGIIGKDPPWS